MSTSLKEGAYIAIGLVAAPLLPALVLALSTLPTSGTIEVYVISILGWLAIGYMFAAVATLAVGVPLFFVLRHFDLARWWSALIVGFLIGIGVILLLASGGIAHPGYLLLWGGSGAASALVFWAIWKLGARARPGATA